jgi:S1-C subfamily serine protease
MRAQFTFLTGARAGQTDIIGQPVIIIGRHPDCDVRFDADRDLDVSARHASLTLQGNHYVLRDLDSTNGTYLQGRPVRDSVALSDKEVIRFGPSGPKVEFTAISAASSDRPSTPEPAFGTAVFGSQSRHETPSPPPRSSQPAAAPRPTASHSDTAARVRIEVERQTRGLRRTTLLLFALLLLLAATYFWQVQTAARRIEADRRALLSQVDSLVGQIGSLSAGTEGLRAALESAHDDAEQLRRQLASAPKDPGLIRELRNRLDAALQQQRSLAGAASLDARSVAAANRDAIALVFVQFPNGAVYTGTAFAVRSDAHGGLLVTNRHVVSDSSGTLASKIGIVFEGTRQNFRADVVRIHPDADVALIRATVHQGFPVVTGLADPGTEIRVGDPVALLGFPLGLELAEGQSWGELGVASSLTLGTVSRRLPNLVQVEGYGAQGSSGSPIFDRAGHVIAVLYGGQTGTSGRILYGVPVRYVHQLLETEQ